MHVFKEWISHIRTFSIRIFVVLRLFTKSNQNQQKTNGRWESRSYGWRREKLGRQFKKWKETLGDTGKTITRSRVRVINGGNKITSQRKQGRMEVTHREVSKATALKVAEANVNTYACGRPSKIYEDIGKENIFTLEHINVHGLRTKCGMAEVKNFFGIKKFSVS